MNFQETYTARENYWVRVSKCTKLNYIGVYPRHYNFACCYVWVWNMVVDIAGGKKAEGVWEHGFEENIWTEEGRGNGGMEKFA